MNMTGTTVILLLVAAWLLQLGLSYWQMRRFYRRLAVIRRDGLTAIGMEGSAYKRRVYGVLCVDAAGRIRHAEQLSGWTIFAGLKRVPALEGRSLNELLGEAPIPHMTPKPWQPSARRLPILPKPGRKEAPRARRRLLCPQRAGMPPRRDRFWRERRWPASNRPVREARA
jgi:glucitol operon activator protein